MSDPWGGALGRPDPWGGALAGEVDDGEWVRQGIYLVNTRTGERKLYSADSMPEGAVLASEYKAPEPTYGERLLGSAASATASLGSSAAEAARLASYLNPASYVGDARGDLEEAGEYLGDLAGRIDPGLPDDMRFRDYLRENPLGAAGVAASKALPSLGAMALAAPVAGTTGASALMAGISGSAFRKEAIDRGVAPLKATAVGAGLGGLSYALEKAGLEKVLLGRLAGRRATIALADQQSPLIRAVVGAFGEGNTELAQETATLLAESFTDKDVSGEAIDRLLESAIGGGVSGGAASAVSAVTQTAAPPDPQSIHRRDVYLAKYTQDPAELLAPRTAAERFQDAREDLMARYENADRPIVKLAERAGIESADLAELVTRQRRSRGAEVDALIFGATEHADPVYGRESLADVWGGADDATMRDLSTVLISERAIEIGDRIRAGETDLEQDAAVEQEARDELAAFAADSDPGHVASVMQMAERTRSWLDRVTIQPLVEVGYLSEELADQIRGKNRKYAPFHRVQALVEKMEQSEFDGASVGAPVAKIHGGLGGDKKVLDPIKNIVSRAGQIARFKNQLKVQNMVAGLVDSDPNLFPEIKERLPGGPGKPPVTRQTPTRPGEFASYQDGKKRIFKAPPDLVNALGGVDHKTTDLMSRFLRLSNKIFKAGVTTPLGFAISNAGRDQFEAAAFSQGDKTGGVPWYNPGKYGYIPFVDMFNGFLSVAGVKNGGKAYYDFIRQGGGMSSFVAGDLEDLGHTVRDIMAGTGGKAELDRMVSRVKRAKGGVFGSALRLAEEASQVAEQSTRVGQYERAIKNGYSEQEAMMIATGATLDFTRLGSDVAYWNRFEPFVGPQFADLSRLKQAMKRRPGATMLRLGAFFMLPSLAHWALRSEDDEYQNEVPEWEKIAYQHWYKREDGSYVKAPRPLGIASVVFGYGLERVLDAAADKDSTVKDRVKSLFGDVGHAVVKSTPIDYVANPVESLPAGVQPTVEALTNYSEFRGREVVPRSMEGRLPRDRYFDSTDPAYIAAARELGKGPLLHSDVTSPLVLQHIFEGYTGTVGREVVDTLNPIFAGQEGGVEAPENPLKQVPVVGRFVTYKPYGPFSVSVKEMYERRREIHQVLESYQRYQEQGDAFGQVELLESHGEMLQKAPELEKIYQDLRRLIKDRDAIKDNAQARGNQEALDRYDRSITDMADRWHELAGTRAGREALLSERSRMRRMFAQWQERNPDASPSQASEVRQRLNESWLKKHGDDPRYYPPIEE